MLYIRYVALASSVLILTQQKLAQYKFVDSKLGLGIPNLIISTSQYVMTFSCMFYFSVEGTEPPVSKKHKSEEVNNETKDVQPSEPSIPTESSQPGMTFAQHVIVML